jgi:hypothetical protein
MPIDPRISLGVQQLQVADPVAQYGQVQNILAAQDQRRAAGTQNELAQLQLGQARTSLREVQEAQDYITQVMAEAKKNNAPTSDPMDAAMQMLRHPNAKVREAGQSLFDANQKVLAYQQDKSFANRTAPQPLKETALAPADRTKAVPAIGAETYDAWLKDGSDLPYRDWLKTQPNALAPAAAPAAPVNALAAAPAVSSKADQIRAEITDLRTRFPYSAKAKEQITFLNKELEQLTKAYTVGSNLVSGEGKEIYTGKVKETDSDFEKLLAKTNLTEDEKKAMRLSKAKKDATHAPGVSVSYGPQEKEEKKEYGKLLIDDFKGVKAQATVAQKSLPAIESNLATLDKGFDTGFGTETIAAGARVLGALGVEKAEEFATNAQTFLASASAAVLQRQLEQKGPQTESDAQRITATGAQLGNTKEANRFVLNVAKAQLQRDMDQRDFYAKWRAKNKTFEGAEDAWLAGPGGKSLFESPALKKYAVPTEASAAPAKDNRPSLADILKPAN